MRTGIYVAIAIFMLGITNACEKMENDLENLEGPGRFVAERTRNESVIDSIAKSSINVTVEEEDDVDLEFGLTL